VKRREESERSGGRAGSLFEERAFRVLQALVFAFPFAMLAVAPVAPGYTVVARTAYVLLLAAVALALFPIARWFRAIAGKGILFAFLFWVSVSVFFSPLPATALLGDFWRFESLIFWFALAIAVVVSWAFFSREAEALGRFAHVAVTIGGLLAAVYFALSVVPQAYVKGPLSTLQSYAGAGNPDYAGMMCAVLLPLAVWRARAAAGAAAAFPAAALALALLASRSLGSFIAAIAGLALYSVLAALEGENDRSRHDRRARPYRTTRFLFPVAAVLGAAIALICLIWVLPWGPARELKAKMIALTSASGSAGARLVIYQGTMVMGLDRPLVGFGPGTFTYLFPRYEPEELLAFEPGVPITDRVHNDTLQQAVATGFVGVALWLWFFVYLAARAISALRNGGAPPGVAAAAASIAAFFVNSQFMFLLSEDALIVAALAGFILALPRETAFTLSRSTAPAAETHARSTRPRPRYAPLSPVFEKNERGSRFAQRALAAICATLAVAMIVGHISYGLAERAYYSGSFDVARSRVAISSDALFWLPEPVVLAGSIEFDAALATRDRNALARAEAFFRAAIARNRYERSSYFALGKLLLERAYSGEIGFDEARAVYRKSLLISPHFDLPYLMLAKIAGRKGDLATARRYIDRALELDPTRAESIRVKGLVEFLLGDTKGGLADLAKAYENDAGYISAMTLATAYLRAGEREHALAYFKKALSHTQNDEVARIIADLEAGRPVSPPEFIW